MAGEILAEAAGEGTVPAGEIPAEAGGEIPAEAGGEIPAEAGGEIPAEAGGEIPAEAGGEIPAEAGGEIPAEAGGEIPAGAGGEIDYKSAYKNMTPYLNLIQSAMKGDQAAITQIQQSIPGLGKAGETPANQPAAAPTIDEAINTFATTFDAGSLKSAISDMINQAVSPYVEQSNFTRNERANSEIAKAMETIPALQDNNVRVQVGNTMRQYNGMDIKTAYNITFPEQAVKAAGVAAVEAYKASLTKKVAATTIKPGGSPNSITADIPIFGDFAEAYEYNKRRMS